MLRKLLKHEYRATFLPMVIICAVLAVFPIIEGIFMIFYDGSEQRDLLIVGYLLALITNIMLISAAITVVYVLIGVRFYSHIYGHQGYLTLMLPVSRSKLHLSKYIVSMTWLVVCSVVGFTGIIWPPFCLKIDGDTIWLGLSEIFSEMTSTDVFHLIVNIILILVLVAISNLSMISSLYCSASLGQLFRKRRILASALIFFGIYSVQHILNRIVSTMIMFTDIFMNIKIVTTPDFNMFNEPMLYFIITTAISLVFLITQYIITDRILKKKINLQ